MLPISQQTKDEIVKRILAGETIASVAREHKVAESTVNYWVIKARSGLRADGTPSTAKNIVSLKLHNAKPSAKPKQSIDDVQQLRKQLYDEVAKEYKAAEDKLHSLHAKLKFLGEDWNGTH